MNHPIEIEPFLYSYAASEVITERKLPAEMAPRLAESLRFVNKTHIHRTGQAMSLDQLIYAGFEVVRRADEQKRIETGRALGDLG